MAILSVDDVEDPRIRRLYNNSISQFRYSIVVPSSMGILSVWMNIRDFNGILGFGISHRLKMRWNLAIKRCLDLSIVLVGGLIILPLALVIALAVRLSSPGPVLYSHQLIGRNNRPFRMYKFRSMVTDADARLREILETNPEYRAEWEATHKLKHDPRITPLGKILRATSLDEIPQLLNILKGEMSLVGPRPVSESERFLYGEYFDRIFSVKPGLSGLWQVSGRSETSYSDRVAFDTYYLQSWSVWLDLWILYKTVGVVLSHEGAY
jgi:Undecaprenyl-phosphate galactose phosphotransferase WbaP